jgi:hypothetical protein
MLRRSISATCAHIVELRNRFGRKVRNERRELSAWRSYRLTEFSVKLLVHRDEEDDAEAQAWSQNASLAEISPENRWALLQLTTAANVVCYLSFCYSVFSQLPNFSPAHRKHSEGYCNLAPTRLSSPARRPSSLAGCPASRLPTTASSNAVLETKKTVLL